ncbi:hypothetical protein AVEN_19696-1 [Araneus ventricosus]|uniref:Uncharacterized protein n=1 Tax=Araneus ventricosus TaxID=182803 RepID=A0A4Y2C2F9_ARAVE|nr:hypothetical protein AVEN_19696-1 [Araneus ventricosus]
MDFTDLKSDLAYCMKFESAKTASKISIHARSMETGDDTWKERDDKFESLLKVLEKLVNNLAAEQNAPRRNPNTWRRTRYEQDRRKFLSGGTQHHKRTSDGKNVLSRRLCFEGCEPCSNAEKKFRMETDISVEALTMTTENRWSLSEIQKAQLEDPDIRPILKMKLNSADRKSWQEIARESPATKRYWTL